MLTKDFFRPILIDPARKSSTIYIVSGYASANMALHHLSKVSKVNKNTKVKLLIGMACHGGIRMQDHEEFVNLEKDIYKGRFTCHYLIDKPPVHSKVYGWYSERLPGCGFAGSANYTQPGFSSGRREVMEDADAKEILEYYNNLLNDSISCADKTASDHIVFYKPKYSRKSKKVTDYRRAQSEIPEQLDINNLNHVKVSFLSNEGEVPEKSGLNWGQRDNRESNQAYINLKAEVYRTDFFPKNTIRFSVLADDGKSFVCTRAQQSGKAIHTPHNNSLLGKYFRERIGVALGEFVHKSDLEKYGRTDVDFYKIDNENYFMDFSF